MLELCLQDYVGIGMAVVLVLFVVAIAVLVVWYIVVYLADKAQECKVISAGKVIISILKDILHLALTVLGSLLTIIILYGAIWGLGWLFSLLFC